eukprot:TRINITY_DN47152_c0_g1_i3.p1 TRINITY_DN47152_c0_g1~~TRINITY_DN47152_c0_g1_i3.p1  ORF type:complete len:432 (+),score=105.97 TRINITY_DN47152_c0_g1_i3:41-1336(+)
MVYSYFSPIYAFFSDGGGGGERVLWQAVQALLENRPDLKIIIYSGDVHAKPDEVMERARDRFHVEFDANAVRFVFLNYRSIIEAKYYPRFTMIGQSFGTILLAFEALWKKPCSLFCDSTGCAFTYPVARVFFGAQVVCYTHYPTISTDMIEVVKSRTGSYNNETSVSRSSFKSQVKLVYYRLFALAYGFVGNFASVVMVNSSWTLNHIAKIWRMGRNNIRLVYPPCDTSYYKTFPLESRDPIVLSIGQFRPEKNHKLQIQSVLKYNNSSFGQSHPARLVMVGGVRNSEDQQRVADLQKYAEDIGASKFVHFELNAPSKLLDEFYRKSLIGIHTMWNEHFGIGVVEMMAAGLFTIAHNSGGPKEDIISEDTGFLAVTVDEYANEIEKVMKQHKSMQPVLVGARERTAEFSDSNFRSRFYKSVEALLPKNFAR